MSVDDIKVADVTKKERLYIGRLLAIGECRFNTMGARDLTLELAAAAAVELVPSLSGLRHHAYSNGKHLPTACTTTHSYDIHEPCDRLAEVTCVQDMSDQITMFGCVGDDVALLPHQATSMEVNTHPLEAVSKVCFADMYDAVDPHNKTGGPVSRGGQIAVMAAVFRVAAGRMACKGLKMVIAGHGLSNPWPLDIDSDVVVRVTAPANGICDQVMGVNLGKLLNYIRRNDIDVEYRTWKIVPGYYVDVVVDSVHWEHRRLVHFMDVEPGMLDLMLRVIEMSPADTPYNKAVPMPLKTCHPFANTSADRTSRVIVKQANLATLRQQIVLDLMLENGNRIRDGDRIEAKRMLEIATQVVGGAVTSKQLAEKEIQLESEKLRAIHMAMSTKRRDIERMRRELVGLETSLTEDEKVLVQTKARIATLDEQLRGGEEPGSS